MCYSARVRQDLHTLVRRFGGDVDWSSFEALFRLRLENNGIKISRALEDNFENPVNSTGQRSLKEKETKRAREDERIATNKTESYLQRLTDLKRTESQPDDSRIFPMYFAPVVVTDAGRRVIRPMRYTCRLEGKSAFYDRKFPGTCRVHGHARRPAAEIR